MNVMNENENITKIMNENEKPIYNKNYNTGKHAYCITNKDARNMMDENENATNVIVKKFI